MAIATEKLVFSGLAHRLVMDGFIAQDAMQEAIENAKISNLSFVTYLVKNKLIPPRELAQIASQDFGVPLLDLNAYDKTILPLKILREELIQRYHVLPLIKRGEHLYLAVSDPGNQTILDEIKFHTGLNTHGVLVEEDKLANLIDDIIAAQNHNVLSDMSKHYDSLLISSDDGVSHTQFLQGDEDEPIVRYVHKLILEAIHKGASDIHFEPFEKHYRIRFRQDGLLYEIANPPLSLANRIASRIKIMSQLDISERRVPQDGRFKISLSQHRAIDFRISTCPTIGGEKVVMRILDPTCAGIGIDALGFEPEQKEKFLHAISKPQGMVLVTGPTGSGKTVSLYTAINILNTTEVNISTVEDPVEINLAGVNQVNINTKAGLTFASALRAFLRQDPDVIMVGEMRDVETAEIAIKAAQTGHLVLSTLHTNSAPETLSRLANMGIPSYNIATSLTLILAQRLVRRLCEYCKRKEKIPLEVLLQQGVAEEYFDQAVCYGPVGCEQCSNGYKGRIGIYEVLSVTENIGETILAGGSSLDIAKQAKQEGMQTLWESGLKKVLRGVTSFEEITHVRKD